MVRGTRPDRHGRLRRVHQRAGRPGPAHRGTVVSPRILLPEMAMLVASSRTTSTGPKRRAFTAGMSLPWPGAWAGSVVSRALSSSSWVAVGLDNGGTSNNATVVDAAGRFLVDRLLETPSRVRRGPGGGGGGAGGGVWA